jgi:hypothetical protein
MYPPQHGQAKHVPEPFERQTEIATPQEIAPNQGFERVSTAHTDRCQYRDTR